MNKAQESAVAIFKKFLATVHISQHDVEKYGKAVSKFEVEATEYGTFWIIAEIDYTNLPEGNTLRFVGREFWMVSVGKRGGLVARQFPKSFEQFIGRSKNAFGMKFKK